MEFHPQDDGFAPALPESNATDRNDWIGIWTIARGTLRGELTIDGFIDLHISRRQALVRAAFVAENGAFEPVRAWLDPTDARRMTVAIGFPGTRPLLEFHCCRIEGGDADSATLWCSSGSELG